VGPEKNIYRLQPIALKQFAYFYALNFFVCMKRGKDVTIYDLAHELKISVATVSRALKDDPVVSKKTKKKIFELAEKMGYRTNHFARNLRTQETNTIGFMIHELNSNFANSVLLGVEKVTTEAGYDLII